jgi:hypothetical protein
MRLIESEILVNDDAVLGDEETFYKELTSRNFHFVSEETQKKISELDLLIAGCGSTGGACIEPLTRLGVKHFRLADNGTYEVTNLNRQHARLDSIGKNKAVFHAEEVRAIQPFAALTVYSDGLTPENLDPALKGVSFVIDAVDVTTKTGMEMKILLHEECARLGIVVFTALDLGYRQWGMSFDYRQKTLKPFGGKAAEAKAKSHPISSLFTLYPLDAAPDHTLAMIDDLLENRVSFASQLGATSDLLSSIIVAATIRFVESGEVVPGWSIDLWDIKAGNVAEAQKTQAARTARELRKHIEKNIREDRYRLPPDLSEKMG